MMKDTPQGQTQSDLIKMLRLCAEGKEDEFNPHWADTSRTAMDWAADTIEAANILSEENAKFKLRIDELERHNAQMLDVLKELAARNRFIDYGEIDDALNTTPAQSSAWLNKKHVEWLGKPIGEVWFDEDGKYNESIIKPIGYFEKPKGISVYAIQSEE